MFLGFCYYEQHCYEHFWISLLYVCKNFSWLHKLLGHRVCKYKSIPSPKLGIAQLLNFDHESFKIIFHHGIDLHFTDHIWSLAICFSFQGNSLFCLLVIFLISLWSSLYHFDINALLFFCIMNIFYQIAFVLSLS